MITNILSSFQLTEKEISVFMTSLELGSQPASHIAKVCEMPRNTVRSVLDGLVKKGLMVKTRRANTQYYNTEKKENLVRSLKHKRLRMNEQIDDQIDMLETYGEELSARHWATSRPKITFYEGLSGIEKVYEDTLTSTTGLKSWACTDSLYAVLPRYFQTYFKRRAKKNIPMRSIHPDTESSQDLTTRDIEELRESARVPSNKYSWTPEIQIYNNKLNIVSLKEKLGVIIESEEIANAMRVFFDLSFEAAKTYGMHGGIDDYEERIQKKI